MTRIVAGRAKGRVLAVPAKGTRPTSERVREALFSRLDHWGALDGAHVLDLYAGTGALALEALSRGAASADLVEKSAAAARLAARNASVCSLPATVHTADARAYLGARSGPELSGEAGLVLIDPPYSAPESEVAAVLALLGPWIAPDCVVVVERPKRAPAPSLPSFLVLEDTRAWGETAAHFAAPPAPGDPDEGGSR